VNIIHLYTTNLTEKCLRKDAFNNFFILSVKTSGRILCSFLQPFILFITPWHKFLIFCSSYFDILLVGMNVSATELSDHILPLEDLPWYNFELSRDAERYITRVTLGCNDRIPKNVLLADSLSGLQQSIQIKNLACNNPFDYCKQNYSSFSCADKLSFSLFQYKR
jgi:hypothetical protein